MNIQTIIDSVLSRGKIMRFARDVRAIGRLFLILLMLGSMVIGGLLSYLWVAGYYEFLGYNVGPALSITDAVFPEQDTYHFNVTVLHPTFSNITGSAQITQITVSTLRDSTVHKATAVTPSLDTPLQKGESRNFRCTWNWANYTGETVRIDVSVAGESGGSREFDTPKVNVKIMEVDFNSTISVTGFNVTVENDILSETHINITDIAVTADGIEQSVTDITPIPWALSPGETQDFSCAWDWTSYQNSSVTVSVHTLQGYMNQTIQTTSLPVTLNITDILFNAANTSRFSVNVMNGEASSTYVNVTGIAVIVENLTVQEWNLENGFHVDPAIPYALDSNASVTFVCPWNWADYKDRNVTVGVNTLQGFTAQRVQVTPPSKIVNITHVNFDPTDVNYFYITVQNSEFSPEGASVTITEIHVVIEDGIVVDLTDGTSPSPPIRLDWNESRPLTCSWSWSTYIGKDATAVVQTADGYSFRSTPVTLVALTITDVVFNIVDPNHFLFTVKNPEVFGPIDITAVTLTVEGAPQLKTEIPSLPFVLPSGASITFMCSWSWDPSSGKDFVIAVETSQGYETTFTGRVP
ncbi:MAG: hypothetical protein JSV85_05910 [Candidatus Bathyarchaeota archaeon]|nr:MAG: hypothetical protein JSV85_05910 [Candidatus Bathyarchaeota archaeon]